MFSGIDFVSQDIGKLMFSRVSICISMHSKLQISEYLCICLFAFLLLQIHESEVIRKQGQTETPSRNFE